MFWNPIKQTTSRGRSVKMVYESVNKMCDREAKSRNESVNGELYVEERKELKCY